MLLLSFERYTIYGQCEKGETSQIFSAVQNLSGAESGYAVPRCELCCLFKCMVMNTEQTPVYDDDEISLIDIIQFFQRCWRIIGGGTIAIALLTSVFSLSKPPSYEKSMTLQVEENPMPRLLSQLSNDADLSGSKAANQNETEAWASEALATLELEAVSLQEPTYDAATASIPLTLTASQPEPLAQITTDELREQLAIAWQLPLRRTLEDQQLLLDVESQQAQEAITQLEQQLAAVPAENTPRQIALENQRAEVLRQQAELAFQQQYIQDLTDNLETQSAAQLPLTVVEESDVITVARSPLQIAILSLIAGFMVSTLVAILIEQWPRWQAELSAHESEKPEAESIRP